MTVKNGLQKIEGVAISNTLGKGNPFYWMLDENGTIHIARKHKAGDSSKFADARFSKGEIENIIQYCRARGDVNGILLDNSVDGVPKKNNGGFGSYIFYILERKDCIQYASHLSALFVLSEIWTKNEKARGMKFFDNGNSKEWQNKLKKYFNSVL